MQVDGILPLGVKQLEAGREFFLLIICKLETPFGFSNGHAAAAAARRSQHNQLSAVLDAASILPGCVAGP